MAIGWAFKFGFLLPQTTISLVFWGGVVFMLMAFLKKKNVSAFLQYFCGRHFMTVSLKLGRFMSHQHIVFSFPAPPILSLMAISLGVNVTVFSHKGELVEYYQMLCLNNNNKKKPPKKPSKVYSYLSKVGVND